MNRYAFDACVCRFEELKLAEGQPAQTVKETVALLKKAKQAIKFGCVYGFSNVMLA